MVKISQKNILFGLVFAFIFTVGIFNVSFSKVDYALKIEISGAGKVVPIGYKEGDYISGSDIFCVKKADGSYEDSDHCVYYGEASQNYFKISLKAKTTSDEYQFVKWVGNCDRSGALKYSPISECVAKGVWGKKITAVFQKKAKIVKNDESSVLVTVKKTGEGFGKIISLKTSGYGAMSGDGKVNCKGSCTAVYKNCSTGEDGSKNCGTVYFKAIPDANSTFSDWGDGCVSFENEKDQCQAVLDGNKTISAKFNKKDSSEK